MCSRNMHPVEHMAKAAQRLDSSPVFSPPFSIREIYAQDFRNKSIEKADVISTTL